MKKFAGKRFESGLNEVIDK